MFTDPDPKAHRSEDRLVKCYRSYRIAFFGALLLYFVFIWIWSSREFLEIIQDQAGSGIVFVPFFWLFVAIYAEAKIRHIKTIKRYHKMLSELNESSHCPSVS